MYTQAKITESLQERQQPACVEQQIPLWERRGHLTMSMLWITMVTGFPSLLIGFEWYRAKISFAHLFVSVVLASVAVLIYAVPVCVLATRTGLSFKHLSRQVFGAEGNRALVPFLLVIFLGWYTVCALLMADVVCGLFQLKHQLPLLAAVFSFLMAFNNLFGFKGVANFAKYFAAPVLIGWILYSLFKVAPTIPATVLAESGKTELSFDFLSISSFIIGFAIWGNEADYWRHSKPGLVPVSLALFLALLVGEILFPITGWLIAAKTGITDSAQATSFLNQFSFGGMTWLAVLILGANYFAANDSNLYAIKHAVEGLLKQTHKQTVLIIAGICALSAFLLARFGASSALEHICALNCVILPTATVLIVAEWLVIGRGQWWHRSTSATIRWPALVAFGTGTGLGLLTSGLIPGLGPAVGLPPVQAWLLALTIYIPWRLIERRGQGSHSL